MRLISTAETLQILSASSSAVCPPFLGAHRLYRKMGFTECGARELDDVNDSSEYEFEKPL